jgi:hypothetical protein
MSSDPSAAPVRELLTRERLRWIETWAKGWRHFLILRFPSSKGNYSDMPLDVAVAMIEELSAALKDPEWALRLLADELHESGQEIAEAIEARRV